MLLLAGERQVPARRALLSSRTVLDLPLPAMVLV